MWVVVLHVICLPRIKSRGSGQRVVQIYLVYRMYVQKGYKLKLCSTDLGRYLTSEAIQTTVVSVSEWPCFCYTLPR